MNIKQFNKLYGYKFDETHDTSYLIGDIEASLNANNEWVFEIINIYDGYGLYSFDSIDEMMSFCVDYGDIDIWFHNLDFDMLFFFVNGVEEENIKLISSGNMTLSFKLGNLTFKNTLALFSSSLKQLVKKYLGVHDEDWESDKGNVLSLSREELIKYCYLDCIYLYEALSKFKAYFKDTYDMDISLTVPATALKLWRMHFLQDQSFIELNRRHKFFDSGYYFGGHSEKFIANHKVFRNVYYYDVNSLYPYCMRDLEFPNSRLKRTKPNFNTMSKLHAKGVKFYFEALINVDSEALRFFPSLNSKTHTNDYRFGHQVIKGSEISFEFIMKYGNQSNFVQVYTILIGETPDVIKPFYDYVDVNYKKRKSEPNNDTVFKLLLNSLYGKFGQKLEREEKIINSTSDERPLKVVKSSIGYISSYKATTPYYMRNTNRLDIAGKITEKARLLMADYINQIRGKGLVIYTDTDSIITKVNLMEHEELRHLVDDKELGKLSDEIGYKDSFICLGVKMYHFYKSGKKATKGVKNMGLDDFRGVIRGSCSFVNQRFSRFNSLINKGFHGIMSVPYEIKHIRERLDT